MPHFLTFITYSALLAKRLAERKEKAAAIKASHKKYVSSIGSSMSISSFLICIFYIEP